MLKKLKQFIFFIFIFLIVRNAEAAKNDFTQVTPSDVFAVMELTDRCLDVVLKARGIKEVMPLESFEKGLRPMHPYQMAIAAVDMMTEFEKKEDIIPMPQITATPTQYKPANVILIGKMLLSEVYKIADILKIESLPKEEGKFEDKSPTDVFGKALSIFGKISLLAGKDKITPNQTFSEMTRAVSDVKSVLSQIDPAQRFRIDAPVSPGNVTPTDVFKECILIRHDISKLCEKLHLQVTPVPEIPESYKLNPADVFVQAIIIIAELNYLKIGTETVSLTPLAIPVTGKTASDVHQQAVMIRYLLAQVEPLKEMVKKIGK